MKTVIITRHKPLVDWLNAAGITGPVYEQVVGDREPSAPTEIHLRDLQGVHVVGVLPLWIAASGPALVSEVAMPGLPLEARKRLQGGDFTVEEMAEWGAELITYQPPRRLSADERDKVMNEQKEEAQ